VRTPFVAALCTLLAPAVLRAQTTPGVPRVRLVVPAREGCPTLSAVRDDLQRRLGRDVADDAAPRELAVDFVPTPAGWDAWIVVTTQPSGRRSVRVIERHAERCEGLADSVGVSLALAVDADAPEPVAPASSSPTPPATSPVRDDERPAPPPPPRAVAPAQTSFASVALQGGVAFGFRATAAQWGLQVRTARWRWLRATFGFRSVVGVESRETPVVLGLAAGNAGACWAFGGAAVRGGLCAGVEVGGTHSNAAEVGRPPHGDRLWLGAFASAYGHARIAGPVFVVLEGRLGVTAYPELEEDDDPRRPAPVAPSRLTGDLSAGLGIDL